MNKKNIAINIFMNVSVVAINVVIGLFITPRVIAIISAEAYGYVGLANSMTNYITIATTALNSMAGRFISIKMYEGKEEEANRYFSTTFYVNALCVACLGIIGGMFIWHLEKFIIIPVVLESDVKWLFAFTLSNFCLSLIATAFTTATFVANKLYKSSIIQGILAVVRISLLILFYFNGQTRIAFWGLANLICATLSLLTHIHYTRKFTPMLCIKKCYCDRTAFKTLICSGIWNSVSQIASTLSYGINLLITNLWISTVAMGQLNLAQIFVSYVASLFGAITSAFCPSLTKKYAEVAKDNVVAELKISMKMTSFIANIPLLITILWGREFFELWMPQEDSDVLYRLAVLSTQGGWVSGAVISLNHVFTITDKVRSNALFWAGVSVVNLMVVAIFMKYTTFGIYAMAGVGTTTGLFVNFFWVPMYACRCLRVGKYTFYPIILRYMVNTVFILIGLYVSKMFIVYERTWIYLTVLCVVTSLAILFVNYWVLLEYGDRKAIWNQIRRRLCI